MRRTRLPLFGRLADSSRWEWKCGSRRRAPQNGDSRFSKRHHGLSYPVHDYTPRLSANNSSRNASLEGMGGRIGHRLPAPRHGPPRVVVPKRRSDRRSAEAVLRLQDLGYRHSPCHGGGATPPPWRLQSERAATVAQTGSSRPLRYHGALLAAPDPQNTLRNHPPRSSDHPSCAASPRRKVVLRERPPHPSAQCV